MPSGSNAQIARRLKGTICSKISGYEDFLAGLVAEACIDVCPKNSNNFNVDNVRVIKIQVRRGMGATLGTTTQRAGNLGGVAACATASFGQASP